MVQKYLRRYYLTGIVPGTHRSVLPKFDLVWERPYLCART